MFSRIKKEWENSFREERRQSFSIEFILDENTKENKTSKESRTESHNASK